MTEYDKIFWGFIFSAVGVAFGWTLNQLGQWFATRLEDKKNLKVVLFNLLEVYYIIIRSDFDKFVQKLTDKIHSIVPKEHQTDELKKEIYSLYSGMTNDYFKPELSDELKTVQETYQNSIKTLATIDPLSAYYLSGRINPVDTFDKILERLEHFKNQFPSGQDEIEFGANKALEILKPDILERALVDLEKDIRNIAWKINPYTWFKSKRAIKRLKINADEHYNKELDHIFAKIEHLFREFTPPTK